jgi:hypothetical protein
MTYTKHHRNDSNQKRLTRHLSYAFWKFWLSIKTDYSNESLEANISSILNRPWPFPSTPLTVHSNKRNTNTVDGLPYIRIQGCQVWTAWGHETHQDFWETLCVFTWGSDQVSNMCSFWPPLWSIGQSSWLQIRRPEFDSRHYQKKSSGSGAWSTQPCEYNWGATW